MTAAHPGPAELRAWLLGRLAGYLRRPAHEIDPAREIAAYGLESVYVLALCGDIEDHLRVRLDETVVWDHPTVDALTGHLVALRTPERSP